MKILFQLESNFSFSVSKLFFHLEKSKLENETGTGTEHAKGLSFKAFQLLPYQFIFH
jgi:hypothetical protein